MAPWFNFFQSSASVSATLIGLLVVAISINLTRILAIAHMPNRAASAMTPLAGVLTLGMLGQIPGQSVSEFGGEAVAVGLAMELAAGVILARTLPRYRGLPRWWLWSQILFSQGQGVLPAAFGLATMTYGAVGLRGVVLAVIFSVLAALINAWVLLVEIMR